MVFCLATEPSLPSPTTVLYPIKNRRRIHPWKAGQTTFNFECQFFEADPSSRKEADCAWRLILDEFSPSAL